MYAIIRAEKHTSNASISGMEKHIDRTMLVPNANPELAHYNKMHIGSDGGSVEFIDKRINQLKNDHNQRITKASVKAIEYMMTASPEAFGATVTKDNKIMAPKLKGKRWTEFIRNSKKFLIDKHGKENIVKFTIHMDETTPHIHAMVVPVTRDNRLSAKEFLGGTEKLRQLQTDFAKVMEPLGLKRGEKGSKAKHESIRDYYKRIEIAESQIKQEDKGLTLPNARALLLERNAKLDSKDSIIEKMASRIWHLENPIESKKLTEDKREEKLVVSGKKAKKNKGPSL